MKYLVLTLVILVIVCNLADAKLRKQTSLRNKIHSQLKNLKHSNVEDCLAYEIGMCVQLILTADLEYIDYQSEQLTIWVNENDPTPEELWYHIETYYCTDPQSGYFWQCYLSKFEYCFLYGGRVYGSEVKAEMHTLTTTLSNKSSLQFCVEVEIPACLKLIKPGNFDYIKKQITQLNTWIVQNKPDIKDIIKHIKTLYTSDPLTGQFWSCYISKFESCGNIQIGEEKKVAQVEFYNLHKSVSSNSKNMVCLQEELMQCLNFIQKTDFQYLTNQITQVNNWVSEKSQSQDQYKNYLSTQFSADPLTGNFWQCYVGKFDVCRNNI